MALLLGGCRGGGGEPDGSATENPGTDQATPDDQLILTGVLENYTIIVPEYPDQNETQASRLLKESIQERVGVTLTVKSDFVREGTDYTVQDNEILIGRTNRIESVTALGTVYYLGDYYVGVQGSKLVILSNSAEGYAEAVAYLSEHSTASGSRMSVSRDLSYGTLANREEIMNEKNLYPQMYWGFETVENGTSADQSGEYVAVLHDVESKWGYTGNGSTGCRRQILVYRFVCDDALLPAVCAHAHSDVLSGQQPPCSAAQAHPDGDNGALFQQRTIPLSNPDLHLLGGRK